MNNFPIYAEIPDMHKKADKNYVVINPNDSSGGFDMFFYQDIKAKPTDKDWSFEMDDAFIAAEQEYGIRKRDWKKMK